ncbi:MAG: hypothetical protein AB1567_01860 [bacterium]
MAKDMCSDCYERPADYYHIVKGLTDIIVPLCYVCATDGSYDIDKLQKIENEEE